MTMIESPLAPAVHPSPDSLPFWEAAKRHELQLPYCTACQDSFFYPRTLCPGCGSRDWTWRPSAGRGVVYSFCIHHQTSVAGLRAGLPFVTALVTLDEGPRLMAFLLGVPPTPEHVACDMPVEVAFIDLPDGLALPVFIPASP